MKREHCNHLIMRDPLFTQPLNYFPIITRYYPFNSSTYLSPILHMSLNEISIIFSLKYYLHNYLLEMVEEIYMMPFLRINPSDIPIDYKAHPYFEMLVKNMFNF